MSGKLFEINQQTLGQEKSRQLAKEVASVYVVCLLSLGWDLTEWRNTSSFFLYYLSAPHGLVFETVSQVTSD